MRRRTLVFFEAPHRIAECLEDMSAAFGGERRAAVARELTKVFETVYRGTLASLTAESRSDANFTRGEITLVVAGAPPAAAADTRGAAGRDAHGAARRAARPARRPRSPRVSPGRGATTRTHARSSWRAKSGASSRVVH